jgi:hypothetical protein
MLYGIVTYSALAEGRIRFRQSELGDFFLTVEYRGIFLGLASHRKLEYGWLTILDMLRWTGAHKPKSEEDSRTKKEHIGNLFYMQRELDKPNAALEVEVVIPSLDEKYFSRDGCTAA